MPLLAASGLTKRFFGIEVLHDLSFSIEPGSILGLVGENGSGKSTSMNIVAGVYQPDGGSMLLNQSSYSPKHPLDAMEAGVNLIHQELNLFPNLTVEDNLHLSGFPRPVPFLPLIDRKAIRAGTKSLLEQVELAVSPSTLVADLSQGEKQLIEIAKTLRSQSRLIIFDEPTTSLTTREIRHLFDLIEKLRGSGIAVIYISHILEDVLRLCDDILVLRDSHVVGHDRAESFSTEKLITLMVGRKIEQLFPLRDSDRSSDPVLELSKVSRTGVVQDISLIVGRGEVVGLAGLLGAGRSELANIIFGLIPHEKGTIRIKGAAVTGSPRRRMQAGMAFLTEDRRLEGLLPSASISDNIALASLEKLTQPGTPLIKQSALRSAVITAGESVKLRAADVDRQPVNSLSGGTNKRSCWPNGFSELPRSCFWMNLPGVSTSERSMRFTRSSANWQPKDALCC